jgi:hypothetical protein
MTDTDRDPGSSEHLQIFDELPSGLACRVCGALVADQSEYPKVHWDWHEASNGA